MEKQPDALRKHVALIGKTNAGKSTLFNALTGQDNAIVSEMPGTTTDPVSKAMELIPFGAIVLIDTAGLDDKSALGNQRTAKTRSVCRRADAFIYVADINDFDEDSYKEFAAKKSSHLLVFTDIANSKRVSAEYPRALSFYKDGNADEIRSALSALLEKSEPENETIIGDLLDYNSNVIFVIPVDSEAPKGRIILPQAQLLRDCLDHGIKTFVTRETELEDAVKTLGEGNIDLVVTDSQAFAYVNERVPADVKLTSFSVLLARQKGNITQLLNGVKAFENLPDGAEILMLEGCTHNHTHEDIGRVKIPKLLKTKTGKTFRFNFYSGYDFPRDLSVYSAAIQCGNCMINKREALARLEELANADIPVTNYGLILAWINGISDRCTEIFRLRKDGV